MASSNISKSQNTWLKVNHLTYIPPYLSNENIRLVEANNKQNKRHYNVLVYIPSRKHKPYTVVWHNNQWHECYSKARTYRPYLGPFRDKVHATDTIKTNQTDEPAEEDSTSEDDREQDHSICHTPATIKVSSPGSTHREDREPWAPLITPTTANPGHCSTIPSQK